MLLTCSSWSRPGPDVCFRTLLILTESIMLRFKTLQNKQVLEARSHGQLRRAHDRLREIEAAVKSRVRGGMLAACLTDDMDASRRFPTRSFLFEYRFS